MLVTYQEARYHRALALRAAKEYLDAEEAEINALFVRHMLTTDGVPPWDDPDVCAIQLPDGYVRIGDLPDLESLGKGLYAKAWRLNNGRVLKVARPDGTADYIRAVYETCVAYPDHPPPYAPRVFDYGVLSRYGLPLAWYAVMEYVHIDMDADRDALFGEFEGDPYYYFAEVEDLYGCQLDDLHAGNWGVTDDERVVLTDPSSAGGEPTWPSVYSRASHLLSTVRPKLP